MEPWRDVASAEAAGEEETKKMLSRPEPMQTARKNQEGGGEGGEGKVPIISPKCSSLCS